MGRDDSRKHYRCAPDETHRLSAGVYRRGQVAFVGEVLDLSAGGMGVVFTGEDPGLEVDELVALLVTEVACEKEIPVHSRVASVRELEDGQRLYGVEFDEPDVLRDELSQKYRRFFNLRGNTRVWPPLGTSIEMRVEGGLGRVDTTLEDISAGGLAFDVEAECGQRLEEGAELDLTFTLPVDAGDVRVRAAVRHREFASGRALIGVAFLDLAGPCAAAVRAFIASRGAEIEAWQAA